MREKVCVSLQDEEEEEEDDENLGQETLLTGRPGHATEFAAGQLPQYTEDTLVIHGDEVQLSNYEVWKKILLNFTVVL